MKLTTKQKKCDHLFETNGFPVYELVDGGVDKSVICKKCGLEAFELYLITNIHSEDGTIIEEY